MAKFLVVAVRDSAAGIFGQPMCMQSKAVAIRAFADEVNKPHEQNQWNKHPEDFEMFVLGQWDDESGTFELLKSPESLIRAVDCVSTKN